jgi:hypothetical protein
LGAGAGAGATDFGAGAGATDFGAGAGATDFGAGAGAAGVDFGATGGAVGAVVSAGVSGSTVVRFGTFTGSWAKLSAGTASKRKSTPSRVRRTATPTPIGRLPLSSKMPPLDPLCALSVPELARILCIAGTHKPLSYRYAKPMISRNLRTFSTSVWPL